MAKASDRITIRPASEAVNGRSQASLADEWWKLIYSIPVAEHFGLVDDRTDARGRRGSVEKALAAQFDRSVLFIGGGFGEITNNVGTDGVLKIERSIILPNAGKATVFLPMLNSSFDNLVNIPGSNENLTGNLTEEELKQVQSGLFDEAENGGLVSSLFATVDNQKVDDPFAYRQVSESAYSYTTPYPIEGSLGRTGYSGDTYLDNADADPIQLRTLAKGNTVTIGPAVADGYWLALDVPEGAHTISFGGALGPKDAPFFALDTTYKILNQVTGSRNSDSLTGTRMNDYVDAGDGNDILLGMAGDDLLIGGRGRDVLQGGKGQDELWGDGGRDSFLFNKGDGKDTIFDFEKRETVLLTGLLPPVSITSLTLPSGLGGTLIDFGSGDSLTFVGLESSDLLIRSGMITAV